VATERVAGSTVGNWLTRMGLAGEFGAVAGVLETIGEAEDTGEDTVVGLARAGLVIGWAASKLTAGVAAGKIGG
jgi:hypothetical protein